MSRSVARLLAWLSDPRRYLVAAAITIEAMTLGLWPALYLANVKDDPTGIESLFVQHFPFDAPVMWAIKPAVDLLFPGALWSWEQLVPFLFGCVVAGFVAYALAAWGLTRSVTTSLAWILVPQVVIQITMIFTPATMTTDIYNYALYGEMPVVYGANPFVHTPSEFPQSPLYYLIPLYWHDAPSVYGPFWVDISGAVASIFRAGPLANELFAYRFIANASHLLNTYLVWLIARRVHTRSAASAAVAYGWSPCLLVEYAFNGHNDVLMLTLMLLSFLFCLRRGVPQGIVSLGLSVATKYTSILVAPILIVWTARQDLDHELGEQAPSSTRLSEGHLGARSRLFGNPAARAQRVLEIVRAIDFRRVILLSSALVFIVAVLYAPWLEGKSTFGPVLYWMTGPRLNNFWPEPIVSSITTSISNSRHADWTSTYDDVLAVFKIVAKVLLLLWIAVEAFRARSMRDVLAGSARVFIVFLLIVNTWVMPWYFTWPLAVAAALGWDERLVRICAGLTLTATLVMYQRQFGLPVVDEHGGIFLILPILLALIPPAMRLAESAWGWCRREPRSSSLGRRSLPSPSGRGLG